MKTIRTIRLGRWLPVLTLACMGLFWAGLSLVEYRLWDGRIRDHATREVREELARLQRVMGHQLLKADLSAAEQALTWAAVKSPFIALAALNDADTVFLATRFAWKGRAAAEVLPHFDPRDLQTLRQQGSPLIRLVGDGGYIVGYIPIDLGEEGALRPLRKGAIFIDYDLRFERAEFWRGLMNKSAVFGVASLVLAALMLWLLRKLVTDPLDRLAETAHRIESGRLGSDSGLVGNGELANLGRALDRMSRTLRQNLEALQFKQHGIDHTLDSVLWMDAEGRLLDANRGACRMLGYPRDELLTMTLEDIDPNLSTAHWTRHWAELRKNAHAKFETVHRSKQKRLIPVEVTDNFLVYEGKEYNCAIVRDLTDRKRMEKALRAESLRNALLLKTASDGIHVLDETGRVVQANDAFCWMLGYSQEEIVGMHVAEWDAQRARLELEAKVRGLLDEFAVFETVHRRKDGTLFDAEVSATGIAVGEQRLLYCISRDISERKAAERSLRESEARFRELSDAAPVMIWMTGLDQRCEYFNRAWLEFTGRSPEQELKLGTGWTAGVHPDDLSHCLAIYQRAFEAGQPFRVEYRLRRHDGEYRWLTDTGRPRLDGQGRFMGFIGSCLDITEIKQAELELRLAACTFEANEAIIITDADGVIQRANQAYCRMSGYDREYIIGRKPNIVKSDRHDEAFYRNLWQSVLRDGHWQGDIWNRHRTGKICPQWLSITAVRNEAGATTHYVGAYVDMSRQKEAEEQVRQLAYYDTLTGLPNRRLLYDRLQRIFTTAGQLHQYGALLFIDVDNFKIINDTAGHDVGDQLLAQVAAILSRTVRAEDIVARLGGDEFVIVLERLGSNELEAAARTERVAANVIAAMDGPFVLAGQEHHVTLSIGVALFNGDEERPESFLKQADAAMYQAKAAGRNTARFFDPKTAVAMKARVALLAELRKARAADQFRLHCQPVVDDGGRLAGAEVLLRWEHPERGWIEPAEFIPLAEESGLIIGIGTWMLSGACALIRRWEDAGWLAPDFFLAVNISPRQFRQPDFADIVRAAVARAGVAPHRLKLEITEGMLISKLDDIILMLSGLRDAGVRFSLDDFGTGYSSLAYLQRLPLDQIKIDRSFVHDLDEDANGAVIVNTIINMGHSLGLEVVAEGVETQTQFEFLKQRGCCLFQGYLFGRPEDSDKLERNLRALASGKP